MRLWGAFRVTGWLGLALVAMWVASLGSATQVIASPKWQWPVSAPHTVIQRFDKPTQNWLPGHRGIDIAAKNGQSVFAAGSGVVTFAGLLASKYVVVLSHGQLRTTYEPVLPTVTIGDTVVRGQKIGTLTPGASHCATETTVHCLHWGLRRGREYLNPLMLIHGRVRLLPLNK